MTIENLKYNKNFTNYLLVILLGSIFFLPLLGGVHLFDWDEINFAEIAREMLNSDNYLRMQIDYLPFWEKPPFFIWLQAGAMHIFGINEYAARLPNAIAGIITLLFIFHIGKKIFDEKFGWIWVLVYTGSILPHLYFKSGIIDPWFNLFIFSGLYFFILSYWANLKHETPKKNKWIYTTTSGILIGFAILTKGPVGLLIPGLVIVVYWFFEKFRLYVSISQILIFAVFSLAVAGLWFGIEIITHGTWFVKEFILYQIELLKAPVAGHRGFFGYHFIVLFFGCFPASIFAIKSLFSKTHRKNENFSQKDNFSFWMKILFWVVLILFSIVSTKIVHYSSLAYFPLTFLATLSIYNAILEKTIKKWIPNLLLIIGIIISAIVISIPFIGKNIEIIKPLFQKDPFAMANLEAQIRWTGMESLTGILLLTGLIVSYLFFRKNKVQKAVIILFSTSTLFISLTLIFFINKIEGYSQNAAIEFYESIKDKDCYVETFGFKSYAHLFYTKKPPVTNPESHKMNWLLNGNIDKDVYIVTKIHRSKDLKKNKNFKEIGRKNGFVFFLRTTKR